MVHGITDNYLIAAELRHPTHADPTMKESFEMNPRTVWMLALTAALIAEASAQQFVYPAKGQSPEKQKSDEAACYSWAVQQTGFDPAKAQPRCRAALSAGRHVGLD